MIDKSINSEAIKAVDSFAGHIDQATKMQFSKWGSEGIYMSPMAASIYVLYFRNSHLWDSIFLLLSNTRIHGAEFLFRMFLTGVITFDWCSRDVDSRGPRFRLTTFLSTIDYLKYTNKNDILEGGQETIKKAIESMKSRGVSPLPHILDMVDELKIAEKDVISRWYKYFSKKVHGELEEWKEYEFPPHHINFEGDKKSLLRRCCHFKAIASFLQMRNIIVMTNICEQIAYDKIEELESEWAKVYSEFLENEKYLI